MKHRLLNYLTALSLILGIAVLCLWPASYFFPHRLYYEPDPMHQHGTSIGAYDVTKGRLRLYIIYPLPPTITPVDALHSHGTWRPTGAPDIAVPPNTPPGCWPFPNMLCCTGGTGRYPLWGIEIDPSTLLTKGGKVWAPFTTNLFISLWLLAVVAALLPTARVASYFIRRVRQRRLWLIGHCCACGYDLVPRPTAARSVARCRRTIQTQKMSRLGSA